VSLFKLVGTTLNHTRMIVPLCVTLLPSGCRVCPPAKPVEPLQCQGDMSDKVHEIDYCGFGLSYIDNPLLQCILSGRVDFDLLKFSCLYDVCENHLNVTAEWFFEGEYDLYLPLLCNAIFNLFVQLHSPAMT